MSLPPSAPSARPSGIRLNGEGRVDGQNDWRCEEDLNAGVAVARRQEPTAAQLSRLEERIFGAVAIADMLLRAPPTTVERPRSLVARTVGGQSATFRMGSRAAISFLAPAAAVCAVWLGVRSHRENRTHSPSVAETTVGLATSTSQSGVEREDRNPPNDSVIAPPEAASPETTAAHQLRLRPKAIGKRKAHRSEPAATPASAAAGVADSPTPSSAGQPEQPPTPTTASRSAFRAIGDLDLVSRAQRELVANPDMALALVGEYARRNPDGALAEEAETIAVRALVRLGRTEEATLRCAQFEILHPHSGYVRAIRADLANQRTGTGP